MKKIKYTYSLLLLLALPVNLYAQDLTGIEIYLITCGPGTETYSVYGHSALRIIDHNKGSDLVYNWGIFDFSTPGFTWKFAKGRLDYMLGVDNYSRFLQSYLVEKRWVKSQKVNLEPEETWKLMLLIRENLKSENIKYRYDFFYDDCSTRIRDLFEKVLEDKLIYTPSSEKKAPSFRELVEKYQRPFPWLNFGINLIMGTPADKKADIRAKMFLPLEMQEGLSGAVIKRNGKMVPLIQNPEMVLDFKTPVVKSSWLTSPLFVFTLMLILLIIFSALIKGKKVNKIFDIILFSIFSILAVLMIFFNFFTDHQQMKWNLNILWLNPFIIICLFDLIFNTGRTVWFKTVFTLGLLALILQFLTPHLFNNAFIPLLIMILVRSSARSDYKWNPFTLNF